MKVIGITGGVGSGKSRVLSYLEEKHHVVICQADQVAWELQKPGQICHMEIVEHFGTCILNNDKTIDRKSLGQIVFGNDAQLQVLNAIMHPAVKSEIQKCILKEEENGAKLFFLEAALLIEEHYDEICDELWYIYTSDPIRRQRLKDSRQYSDEKIDAIMASQLSEERFKAACKVIIDNSGIFEDTCAKLDDAIEKLGEN